MNELTQPDLSRPEGGGEVLGASIQPAPRDAFAGPARTSKRPRAAIAALVSLTLLGAAAVSWAGTGYAAGESAATEVVSEKRTLQGDSWEQPPTPSPTPTPTPSAKPTTAAKKVVRTTSGTVARAAAYKGSTPITAFATIRIPRFGATWEWPIVTGVDVAALKLGVGWFTQTSRPGEIGNFALSGHRITYGEPFAHLLEMQPGDKVIIETSSAIYTYVMDTSPGDLTVLDATGGWVLQPVPGKPGETPTKAIITLVTCASRSHTDYRSVGFGHLVDTVTK